MNLQRPVLSTEDVNQWSDTDTVVKNYITHDAVQNIPPISHSEFNTTLAPPIHDISSTM